VLSYDGSSYQEAGAVDYVAQVAGAVGQNEGGVDAEDDPGYPKVVDSINGS